MDAYDTVQGLSWSNRSKWICAPERMQLEQAVRVFLKYAEDHPEDLHYRLPMLFGSRSTTLSLALPNDGRVRSGALMPLGDGVTEGAVVVRLG
jgi:hypothetical protein